MIVHTVASIKRSRCSSMSLLNHTDPALLYIFPLRPLITMAAPRDKYKCLLCSGTHTSSTSTRCIDCSGPFLTMSHTNNKVFAHTSILWKICFLQPTTTSKIWFEPDPRPSGIVETRHAAVYTSRVDNRTITYIIIEQDDGSAVLAQCDDLKNIACDVKDEEIISLLKGLLIGIEFWQLDSRLIANSKQSHNESE
jgi:hypothetical protein